MSETLTPNALLSERLLQFLPVLFPEIKASSDSKSTEGALIVLIVPSG